MRKMVGEEVSEVAGGVVAAEVGEAEAEEVEGNQIQMHLYLLISQIVDALLT